MKFLKKTAAVITMLLLSTQPALAYVAQDALPMDLDFLVEINTKVDNPLEPLIEEMVKEISITYENPAENEAAANKLAEFLDDTVMTLSSKTNPTNTFDVTNYATIELTDDQFDEFIELYPVDSTSNYRGHRVYQEEPDVFFAHGNDLFIMTSTLESLHELIDNTLTNNSPTLNTDTDYTEVKATEVEDPFFSLFYDNTVVGTLSIDELVEALEVGTENLFDDGIQTFGVSVASRSDGYNFGSFVDVAGLMFDEFNFVPDMYNHIGGNDIIMFDEGFNFKKAMEESFKAFELEEIEEELFADMDTWFLDGTGTSLEDFMELLTGPYAIGVHNMNHIFPAVTLVVDVNDKKFDSANFANTLNNKLRDYWNEEEDRVGMDIYNYEKVDVNGTNFHQHSFDLAYLLDGETPTETDELNELMFSFNGFAPGGNLVLTTHTNVGKAYKTSKGMLSHSVFNKQFTERDEVVNEVSFIDIDELTAYLLYLFSVENDFPEGELDFITKLFGPWHSLYAKSYAEGSKSWGHGIIIADEADILSLGEAFDELFAPLGTSADPFSDELFEPLEPIDGSGTMEEFPPDLDLSDISFCDTPLDAWFTDFVLDLSSMQIIDGFPDGCFYPNNFVSRAEFIKMAVGAADVGMFFPYSAMSDGDIFFTDVNPDDWFAHYVNQAAAGGFVDGYPDGSFKPHNTISRAEALQILYNLSPILQASLTDEPFTDVNDGDWFQKAVGAAYQNSLVVGKTTTLFDPNAQLTRAEAAKIISLWLDLYLGAPEPEFEDTGDEIELEVI